MNDTPHPAHPAENAAPSQSSGAELRKRIRDALETRVIKVPQGDVNVHEIKRLLAGPDEISNERITAFLRAREIAGFLEFHRREKAAENEAAKDRKIIQYRATEKMLRSLGLIETPQPVIGVQNLLSAIHSFVTSKGFFCTMEDLTNYFLCLQAKPFVILSGISGTGKTRLPRLVAEAIDAVHQLTPVKPNWSDNSDLMGYYSITLDRFVSGTVLDAIIAASEDSDRPYFIVLDEMNLAHVEHYMSDLLSVMETRRRGAAGKVISDSLPIDLSQSGRFTNPTPATADADVLQEMQELEDDMSDVVLPWNLFLIGTVNVDETTHPFSRKVLDRAFAIDNNLVDLTRFPALAGQSIAVVPEAQSVFLDRPLSLHEVYTTDPNFFNQIAAELQEINVGLAKAQLHFGYRVRDEISLYMWAWKRHGLQSTLSRDDAFDLCLLQKVMPRLQGASDTARQALEFVFRAAAAVKSVNSGLADAGNADADFEMNANVTTHWKNYDASLADLSAAREVASTPWRYPRTARKAIAMLQRYADTGFFAFWS